jgi:hypothetical protein
MLTFARDPFARLERTRQTVIVETLQNKTCEWCGQGKTTKAGRPYLYRYGVEPDAGRSSCDARLFCSVQCRDEFYR